MQLKSEIAETYYVASLCNHKKAHRHNDLAVIDPRDGRIGIVTLSWPKASNGITGMCRLAGTLIVGVQGGSGNTFLSVDPYTWKVSDVYVSKTISDVHSFVVFDDHLLVVSSGDNAIYRLHVDGNRIRGDELFWRFPETSEDKDDVHLNAITVHQGRLIGCCFGHRSAQGDWTHKDGRIFDIASGEVFFQGLGQPHSVFSGGGKIHVCESRTGKHFSGEQTDSGWTWSETNLWGYTRGITGSEDGVVIGISSSREVSRIHGTPVNLNVDPFGQCQIVEIDEADAGHHRVIDLSGFGTEVYDIVRIPCRWPGHLDGPSIAGKLLRLASAAKLG